MNDYNHIDIPREKLGCPGTISELMVDFLREGQLQESNEPTFARDSSPRSFTVQCLLGRDTQLKDNISFDLSASDGDSFVEMPKEAVAANLVALGVNFSIQVNNLNRLSSFTATVEASNFAEACNKVLAAICPFLDYISYQANIPISITKIKCKDLKYQAEWLEYTVPYGSVTLNPHERALKKEMAPVYALYREAKNSKSHFYRFLCYYKILEGIYCSLRPALHGQLKKKGIILEKRKEVLEEEDKNGHIPPLYRDKHIKVLFDTTFRSEFRDAMAHFQLKGAGWLTLSDYSTLNKYANVIEVIERCCRIVIKNQEEYYDLLNQTGAP